MMNSRAAKIKRRIKTIEEPIHLSRFGKEKEDRLTAEVANVFSGIKSVDNESSFFDTIFFDLSIYRFIRLKLHGLLLLNFTNLFQVQPDYPRRSRGQP